MIGAIICGLLFLAVTHYTAYMHGTGHERRQRLKSYRELQDKLPKAYRLPNKRRR